MVTAIVSILSIFYRIRTMFVIAGKACLQGDYHEQYFAESLSVEGCHHDWSYWATLTGP
jgi:hypothetical protein